MRPLLSIEPEADQELAEAALGYERERSGLGERFLEEVEVTLERIRQFPRAGALVPHVSPELGARRAPVRGFPFQVVYLAMADAIRVLAFAHYRRRPGYWVGR